ncbi:hypothetical protein [Wolbachia endosymbiont of Folsomia candida]|uniref:hypothetical protein n=1 Tax=Wolbachia endosymbiont of Folsomia candida TaxID=169402 RepID=UPI000AC9CD59|nr:hypothetical protein [Wolbachia endosymbiont of Folsomia candida]APR98580.1 hypothetical protein ASM33_04990 [Wolbachia endosymbiont of Folsomia candida]
MLKSSIEIGKTTEQLLESYQGIRHVFSGVSNSIDPVSSYQKIKTKILEAKEQIKLLVQIDIKLETERKKTFSSTGKKKQLKQARSVLMKQLIDISHEIKTLHKESITSNEYKTLQGALDQHCKLLTDLQQQVLGNREAMEVIEDGSVINDEALVNIKAEAMKVVNDIDILLFGTQEVKPSVLDSLKVEAARSGNYATYSTSTL